MQQLHKESELSWTLNYTLVCSFIQIHKIGIRIAEEIEQSGLMNTEITILDREFWYCNFMKTITSFFITLEKKNNGKWAIFLTVSSSKRLKSSDSSTEVNVRFYK